MIIVMLLVIFYGGDYNLPLCMTMIMMMIITMVMK